MVNLGDEAPAFCLPGSGGRTVQLDAYAGRWLLLYFYPKDMTSGCTAQACALRDVYAKLRAAGADVVGISKDKPARHDAFVAKEALPFVLLSDEDAAIAQAYGAWGEKSLYGRKYMGPVRSSFLVDPDGRIRAIWRKVKVPGHAEAALAELVRLQAG